MTLRVGLISEPEAEAASNAWGCNCGPAAVAAIMGMTLSEVRPFMGEFERKSYTNPTLMWQTFDRIGRPWRKAGAVWPRFGLARIQWEGPWMQQGVPIGARYRHTHWVGSWKTTERGHGIFDINATYNGTGWCSFEHWVESLVPHITHHVPRANGKWHVTHGVEIEPIPLAVAQHAASGVRA